MKQPTRLDHLLKCRNAGYPSAALRAERVAEAAVFSADFSITAGYSIHHVEYPLLLFGERQFTVMFSNKGVRG